MVDEIFDRHYQDARSRLNRGIATTLSHLARTLRESFNAQHRLMWSAPWLARGKRG
jgi:hypothetical protein